MQVTRLHKQYAFVGDEFDNCTMALFSGADYAGDTDSMSTSGVFVAVAGPRTLSDLIDQQNADFQ